MEKCYPLGRFAQSKSVAARPIIFALLLLLTTYHASALNYYWVNGNGAWSQFATHWAKIPNPTMAAHYHANVPTADDDVYFGANGGTAYTVNVDAGSTVPKCQNMDWTGVPAGTVWGGFGSRIEIYGSTTLDANMSITFNGSVRMTSFDASMKSIVSNTVHFGVETEFVGTDGGWNFVGDFYANGRVNHEGGLIETNGQKVTIGGNFYGNYYGSGGQLHLGSSEFNIVGYGYFNYSPGQFDAGTSHIKFLGANVGLVGPINFATPINFYDVSFLQVCTSGGFVWGNIDGTLTFHQFGRIHSYSLGGIPVMQNVVFLEDGWIANATNYKNLTFTAGKTYTIENQAFSTGTDQTILPGGSLTALGAGNCSGFITIKSWQYGTPVNFVNNSGTQQTVHCGILEDIHATGSDPLEVIDGVNLGNSNVGWIFTNPHGAMDLYWIGGDGDWNDPAHWSEIDGGAAGTCIPNGATSVHFTALSGFSPGDKVTVPDAAYCANMDWTGVTGMPEFFQPPTSTLNIYGSLKYATPAEMTTVLAHITNFRGSNIHTITTSGQLMGIYSIFEGSGEYRFADAFTSQKFIAHLRGKVKTMGHPVSVLQWFGSFNPFTYTLVNNSTAEVWFGDPVLGVSSTVTFTNTLYPQAPTHFFNEYQPGKFHAMNSHIVMQAGPGNRIETRYTAAIHNYWKITMAAGTFERGNVLDKLTFTSRGNIDTYGDFNEVEFYENAVIRGNHSYNALTMRGGYFYQILDYNGEGNTQTINAGGTMNVLNADCEHLAYLNSGDPVTIAKIAKIGGSLNLQHVILDNVLPDLTTGATYSATNSFGIQPQVVADWNIASPAPRNLFWVGGSGIWHDSNHWSLASGGAGGECPPTPADNVRFDAASGLGAGSVVDVTQIRAFCKDMDWTGVTGGAKFYTVLPPYTPNQMTVFGSLTFSSGMENDFAGDFWMRAKGPATITSAGKHFKNSLLFWETTGDWILNDPLSVDYALYHIYGTFRTNNQPIDLGFSWEGGFTTPAEAFLGSSTVHFLGNSYNGYANAYIYYQQGKFHSETSHLIFENNGYIAIFAGNPDFYDVTFNGSGYLTYSSVRNKLIFEQDGTIGGDISYLTGPIHDVEFKGNANIQGSREYHSMKFFPGKRYTFFANTTQTILPFNGVEGQFIAQGLPGQYIEMRSDNPSVPAIIHMDDYNGTSTCTKYLFLTGMTHTGTEDIYVPTPGGNVFNNSGWQFFPCNPCPASIPVLAANSITVGCAPGQARLILDGLKPDEWAIWYTDPAATTNIVYNGGTTGPAGNLFEPLITGPVTYYARVYSDGGLCESTVILAVNITTIAPPAAFNVTGGGTVCVGSAGTPVELDGSVSGVRYQLQINGIDAGSPVDGTGSALAFGNQTAAGTYTVVATIIGTGCPADMTGSAVVTGNPLVAPAIVASSNAPLCIGNGALLLSEGGGELVNWSWTGPSGFLSTDQNPVILNPTPTNSGVYSVTGSSVNGCSNSQSILVTVHPQPDATITTSAAAQVCPGTTGYTASVPNAGPGAIYTWTILNGTITGGQGTNNITYNVDGVGQTVLSVTVVGAGGCSAAGCNNTFIQSLGNMGGSQPNIFPHPNGDFFATGLRNDSMVIVRFDPSGTPLWARAFRLGTNTLLIRDMLVDASGDLIGVAYYETGFASQAKSTVFRYNIASHSFVWVQHISDVLFTNIHDFDANNCILTGTGNVGYTQLAHISKSTGAISTYALQGEGGDYYSVLQNGHLYGACRRYYTASTDLRASVFSHDAATGAFEWQNSLISEGNANGGSNFTRMYPEKPALDNDSLVVLASGDLVGFDLYLDGPTELVVAKTDLLGNLGWTKQYLVSGYDRPVAARIANTADGYYIVANMYLSGLSNFGFGVLIKTDKRGNVQWAKRLGISGKNIVKNIMERNGFLHLVMASDSYAPNELLLLKLDLQGNSNTACDFIQPITVTVNHLLKVQNARPYTVSNRTNTLTPLVETPNPTSFSKVARCSTPCSNSLVVNVVQPDAGFISGPISICVDEVGLLTSSGVSGGFWGSSDPTVAQVDANTGHVFGIAPGNCFIGYFVTVNGCSNSVDFPMEVRPLPVLNPVSNSPVCSGGNLEFNETSGNATNWNWFNLNGYYAGGIRNPMIQNVTPANSGTYTVAGTGLNGCTGYADVTVLVHPTPTMIDIPTDLLICSGSSMTLYYQTDDPFTYYLGTVNGANAGTNTFDGIANYYNPDLVPEVRNLTVTPAHNYNGLVCTGITHPFTITVMPYPEPYDPGDMVFCANESVPLIPHTGRLPTAYYTWTNDNPAIGLAASGAGDIPAFTALNGSSAPMTANIRIRGHYDYGGITCMDTAVTRFQVTVNPLPTMTCPPAPTVGLTDPAFQLAGATPSGGIYSGPNVTNGTFNPLAAGIGSHPVAYDYTDGNGCPGSCAFNIVVQNVAPPDITCPADVVKTTDLDQCSAVVNYPLPVATDLGGSPVLTLLSGWPSGSVFPLGTTVIVWQATGISGLTATCSFSVTVSDGQNPSIVCPLNIVRNTDPNFCSAVVTYTSPTFSDNCPGAYLTLTSGLPSGSAFPIGVNMVNWKATDAAGRMAICGFTVTVKDAQAPTITCPKSFAANTTAGRCDAAVTYATPVMTDNCPGAILIRTSGPASGAIFLNGATLVTYEARDAATPANVSTCSFTVTVNDAELPKPVCPSNQSKNTDVDKCTAKVNYAGTFTDNCAGGSLSIQSGLASGSDFPKGVTTVVLKATDVTGLTKTCSFKVTVNDVQAPAINCQPDIAKNTDNNLCSATATYTTPTFTDNCMGGSVVKISGLASGSAFPKGTNVVVWRATDAAGLTKTCSIKVTVTDAQLPAITCPANIVKSNDPNLCGAATTYPTATATDNCPGVTATLLSGLASGAVFPLGTSQVVWKATDAAGLTKTCAFSVQVNDTQAPMLMCPGNTTVNGGGTPCGYPSVQLTGATVMLENCLHFTLTSNAPANLPPGATVVTWTATDLAGNVSNCAYTVTVGCSTAPSGGESRSKEVGLMAAADGLDLRIAPNPAISQVTLRMEGLGASGGELTVFDPLGRMVWHRAVEAATQQVMLDVSGPEFPQGLYQVRLKTTEGMVTKGLVVMKL